MILILATVLLGLVYFFMPGVITINIVLAPIALGLIATIIIFIHDTINGVLLKRKLKRMIEKEWK